MKFDNLITAINKQLNEERYMDGNGEFECYFEPSGDFESHVEDVDLEDIEVIVTYEFESHPHPYAELKDYNISIKGDEKYNSILDDPDRMEHPRYEEWKAELTKIVEDEIMEFAYENPDVLYRRKMRRKDPNWK